MPFTSILRLGSIKPFGPRNWNRVLLAVVALAIADQAAAQTGVPKLSLSPTSQMFGNQVLNVNSVRFLMTVTSAGTADLSLTAITISGANASDFTQDHPFCGSTVPSGTSCNIFVMFTPKALGARTAVLTVASDGGSATVALSGTGIGAPHLSVGLSSLAFSHQKVNVPSVASPVPVTNSGTAVMAVTGVTVTGASASEFVQTNNCGAKLVINGACSISVTFTPASLGARAATLNIESDGGAVTVPLSGTGDPVPKLSLSPTSQMFGNLVLNANSVRFLMTVTSAGAADLSLTGITISGANASDFKQDHPFCGSTLPSGTSCNIFVMFTPKALGARTAVLTVASDGGSATVALSGTGIQAK
jgi:hypothetical protein